MPRGRDACPHLALHTAAPLGYLAWHEWAERMAKTHDQRQCPGCGLWAIWTPKAHSVALEDKRVHEEAGNG